MPTKISDEKLANDWIAFERAPEGSLEREKYWHSYEQVDLLSRNSPEECWEVILQILKADLDMEIMANLAAGPVEDLLLHNGNRIIERIERDASSNEIVRRLLGGVWKNNIEESVWKRVQALVSAKW